MSIKHPKQHKNISKEQIAQLEQKGLVHAGYDPIRNREIFNYEVGADSSHDPQMLPREYVNITKYDLVITRTCTPKFKYGSKPSFFEFESLPFPPDKIIYMPHGYYKVTHPDGSLFEGSLLINWGDAMFKNNHLPSRPEPKISAFRAKR